MSMSEARVFSDACMINKNFIDLCQKLQARVFGDAMYDQYQILLLEARVL